MPIFKVKKYVSYPMATHFQWYPSSEETVVPFNARYSFPSQINKSVKVTPRLPPVSGTTFTPGQTIKINFPAQGYMNPRNTTLTFDVTLNSPLPTAGNSNSGLLVHFQNNIQSIFQKVRLLYGSTPLEDISNYNVLVRQLTEWTGTQGLDQSSVSEGVGTVATAFNGVGCLPRGVMASADVDPTRAYLPTPIANGTYSNIQVEYALDQTSLTNVRSTMIQGIDYSHGSGTPSPGNLGPVGPVVSNAAKEPPTAQVTSVTRRYQIQLALGLFTQEKLIPLKWMASQLSVELTLAPSASCIIERQPPLIAGALPTGGPQAWAGTSNYSLSNVSMIPEILEFDASYDAMFLKGLREGGVPIKFSSWHTYTYPVGGQNLVNFIIPEKSRSVKSIFTLQRRGTDIIGSDSGTSFFATGSTTNVLQNYQYRIGGRYFPASPVQCSSTASSSISNGGAEAFTELQKALNQLGDSRLSVPLQTYRWAVPETTLPSLKLENFLSNVNGIYANEADFHSGAVTSTATTGELTVVPFAFQGCSHFGSTQFCAAIDLETSSGVEIAGLNAEEQSDISFVAQYSGNQRANYNLEAYVYYDAMLVLRENNVLELIQ